MSPRMSLRPDARVLRRRPILVKPRPNAPVTTHAARQQVIPLPSRPLSAAPESIVASAEPSTVTRRRPRGIQELLVEILTRLESLDQSLAAIRQEVQDSKGEVTNLEEQLGMLRRELVDFLSPPSQDGDDAESFGAFDAEAAVIAAESGDIAPSEIGNDAGADVETSERTPDTEESQSDAS